MYPLKKKSDEFSVFKEYKAWVKLKSGKKIKCLRIDNGGECIQTASFLLSVSKKVFIGSSRWHTLLNKMEW